MLNEINDVFPAVPKNSDSFVFRYVTHAAKSTTANAAFHLGTALTLVGVTAPSSYGIRYASQTLRPNLFVMCVGVSGDDFKSSALRVGYNLLRSAAPKLAGDEPGSMEGLVDSLQAQPHQLIRFSEFGKFLSQTGKGSYAEPIKLALNEAFDCDPLVRKLRKTTIRADNPRLGLLAAVAITYLANMTTHEDWEGGFLNRWAVLFANAEREDSFPVADNSGIPWLKEWLKTRSMTNEAGFCTGLSPESRKLWDQWYYGLKKRPDLPQYITGLKARAPVMALKAALCYGWDIGPASEGEPWQMEPEILQYGLAFADLHIRSLASLEKHLADTREGRLRKRVMNAMPNNGAPCEKGDLLEKTGLPDRDLSRVLSDLTKMGKVTVSTARIDGRIIYARA